MENLVLTPFSKEENSIDFELNTFEERDMQFAILFEINIDVLPKNNNYRFGLITPGNQKYWFFEGLATTDDRVLAINVYNELLNYCNKNNLGTPFAYKEYEKRE